MNLTEVIYDSDNYCVLDFETTNRQKGSALESENRAVLTVTRYKQSAPLPQTNSPIQPTGAQQADGRGTKIVWGSEYSLGAIIRIIEQSDFLVAHNAKFELQWLERAGLDLSNVVVFDTLLAEYVLHGGLSVPLSLDAVAKRYGFSGKEPYVDICMKGGVCPSELPKSLLERRCIYDVNVTEKIFLEQRRKLKETNQLNALWTRCILTPVLADIEKNGMCLDNDRVMEKYTATIQEFNDIKQQLEEMTGGINLNSAKQRGEFIYETLDITEPKDRKGAPIKTAAGGYKTDQATILSLRGRNKKQKQFLALYGRYAGLNAKLTKSLNTYKEVIDSGDLLHAQFNQARTKTQRLSSSGLRYSIQFQNQAREFKPLYRARDPDWLIAEIDGAQLEFRVAAFLGQDATAVHDIENGFDVHSYTASVMTDAGQPTSRQEAKAHTFKPLTYQRL